MKFEFTRKQVKLSVLFLVAILLSSLGGYAFAQAGSSPNIYLDDLPASATYTIKTDGTNYWAIRYDGAISFSSTSASVVFQNAIDTGKDIFISAGTYALSAAIELKRQTKIEGAGTGVTILNFNGQGFYTPGNTTYRYWGITISKMSINGVNTSSGIDLSYTYSSVRLEKLQIEQFDSALKLVDCYAISVKDCEFNYNSFGIYALNAQDSVFDNNKFYGNTVAGLGLYNCAGAHIVNNDFESNSGTGLINSPYGGYTPDAVQIINNYFENNGRDIIEKGVGTNIAYNRFIGIDTRVRSISVEANDTLIVGNFFIKYTSDSIWLVSGYRIFVTMNRNDDANFITNDISSELTQANNWVNKVFVP